MSPEEFIARWKESGAHERANAQSFLKELCDLIGVPHPDPAKPNNEENAYVFERTISYQNRYGDSKTAFVDLYKPRSLRPRNQAGRQRR